MNIWCFFPLSNLIFLSHEHPFDSYYSVFMLFDFREGRSLLFFAQAFEVVSNYDLVHWKLI